MNGTSTHRHIDRSEPEKVKARREMGAEWIRELCPETRRRGVDGNGVSPVSRSLVSARVGPYGLSGWRCHSVANEGGTAAGFSLRPFSGMEVFCRLRRCGNHADVRGS